MTILNTISIARRTDSEVQVFSPTIASSINMASAANMIGKIYTIVNGGTAYLQVNASDGSIIGIVNPGCSSQLTPNADSPATSAQWTRVGSWKEYAYNTSTQTSAGASDSSSFAYGPTGTFINAVNSSTSASHTNFNVQWLVPALPTDKITVELNNGFGVWISVQDATLTFTQQTAYQYGIAIVPVSTTQAQVRFHNGGYGPGTATGYAAAGGTWSSITTWMWRAVKYTN